MRKKNNLSVFFLQTLFTHTRAYLGKSIFSVEAPINFDDHTIESSPRHLLLPTDHKLNICQCMIMLCAKSSYCVKAKKNSNR